MAFVLKDRVKETTATAGTGSVTLLGASQGYQGFSAIGDGNTTYYCIAGVTEWEVGIGTYSGGVLSRDTVLASSVNNTKVAFSSGTKDVFCTYAADKAISSDNFPLNGAISTASPNDTVNVASLTANVSTTNGDAAFSPKGTGALLGQVPTATTAGGNKRGAGAVDWQLKRSSADMVASGSYSTIGGGENNKATNTDSTIAGGTFNQSTGIQSSVGGGNANVASGTQTVVAGGAENTASATNAAIGGGRLNVASVQYATIAGGREITVSGTYSFAGGGQLNSVTATRGAISGGQQNLVSSAYAGVHGGLTNTASGSAAFVGGGESNTASGGYTAIAGGYTNAASALYASVVGGTNNTASGASSTVAGGATNVASGARSIVAGGSTNTADGYASSIIGGVYGTTKGITGYTVIPGSHSPIEFKAGVSQSGVLVLGVQTTSATSTKLRSDSNAADATNQLVLANNSATYFRGTVIANVTGGGDTKSWTFDGQIKRGANAAATTLTGSTVASPYGDAGASTWTVALSADTTNGGLAVTVTGQASTTIRWVCRIETTEVSY